MRKIFSLLLLTFLFIFSSSVFAHPGRTAADGCHYCRTRCDYWGVPWNQRHCHGSGTTTTNTPIPWPTWTPIPIYTLVPTNMTAPTNTTTSTLTSIPTPMPTKSVLGVFKSKVNKVVNKSSPKKKIIKKKTFWQWLLNR